MRCAFARSRASGVTGAVALAHQDVPVVPRHEAGVRLGADEEDRLGRAALDEAVDDLDAEEHRAALLADVERGDAVDPELGPYERRGAGEHVVRRHRGEDDVVDVPRGDSRGLDGALGRLHTEVARTDPFGRVVALPDPGSLEDPFVGRVHHAGQVGVGDGTAGDVVAGSDDLEADAWLIGPARI